MKKLKKTLPIILLAGLAVLALTIISLKAIKEFNVPPEIEVPPMVMIDDIMYQLKGDYFEEPESPASGTIEKVTLEDEEPSENGEANFGEENMEYWVMDDYIVIKFDEGFLKLDRVEE